VEGERSQDLLRPERRPARWNQATLKGAVLVLAGIAVIATPDDERPFRAVLGVGVLVWAAVDLWIAATRSRPQRGTTALRGGALALVGLALVALTEVEISAAVGAGLLVVGVVMVLRRVRSRSGDGVRWTWLTAVPVVALGGWLLLVPSTSVLAVRALIGAAAMLLGGILLRIGSDSETGAGAVDASGVAQVAMRWLEHQRLGAAERDDLAETLYFDGPRRGAKLSAFWVMMGLATAIASFAVIQDSTAVVIGAMLVAPLMTPIMGTAAAAVNGWPRRVASSLLLVAAAAAAAVALAWIITAWLPSVGDLLTNSQVTSRVQPNLLDLCIALAAGAAGAYATVNPRVSSSLSGVAIAVALVPPLAVVGITLEAGFYGESVGALLLFGTNFVCIVLSSALVFVLTGFSEAPPGDDQRHRFGELFGTILTVAVLIAVPLSLTTQQIWSESRDQGTLSEAVGRWLPEDSDLDVVDLTVSSDGAEVELTGSDSPPPVDPLARDWARATGRDPSSVDLTVRVTPSVVLRPGD